MRRSLHAGRFGKQSEEFLRKDHVEVEWQFEVTDLDLAESWLKKHSPTSDLAAIPDSTKELLDAYYDTRTGAPTPRATPCASAGTARALRR